MVSKLALGAIWGYQRFISPHKGYRCAHSVLHGGTGCSGYVKYAIRDYGLWRALPLARARFKECRQAYDTIRASRRADEDDDEAEQENNTRRRKKECWDWSSCCAAPCEAGPCLGGTSRGGAKGGIFDTNPCDGDGCGLECGGCDVCTCDICSCG